MRNSHIRHFGLLCVLWAAGLSVTSDQQHDNISDKPSLVLRPVGLVIKQHKDAVLEELTTKDVTGEKNVPLNSGAARREARGKGSPDEIAQASFPRNSPRSSEASERSHHHHHSSSKKCCRRLSKVISDICKMVDQLKIMDHLLDELKALEGTAKGRSDGGRRRGRSELHILFDVIIHKLKRDNDRLKEIIKRKQIQQMFHDSTSKRPHTTTTRRSSTKPTTHRPTTKPTTHRPTTKPTTHRPTTKPTTTSTESPPAESSESSPESSSAKPSESTPASPSAETSEPNAESSSAKPSEPSSESPPPETSEPNPESSSVEPSVSSSESPPAEQSGSTSESPPAVSSEANTEASTAEPSADAGARLFAHTARKFPMQITIGVDPDEDTSEA